MSILFPAVLVSITALTGLVVLYAVAVRGSLQPATVDPFQVPTGTCSSDTVANQAMVKTVLKPASDWQITTLTDLSKVESLLDALEAHGFVEREVVTLSDSEFAVRWR